MKYDTQFDGQHDTILQSLLELMDALDIPRRSLLWHERTPVVPIAARDGGSRQAMERLVQRAVVLSGHESLGLQWSKLGRPFGHGTLLYALAEALRVRGDSSAPRWVPWLGTPRPTSLCSTADSLLVRVESSGSTSPVFRVYVEAIFAMFLRLVQSGSSSSVVPRSASFTYPSPSSIAEYSALFCCPTEFDAEACVLVIPLSDAHDATRSFAPLSRYGQRREAGVARSSDGQVMSWSEAVRESVDGGGRVCARGIGDVASALGTSVRTLRRKLAREGTGYSQIARRKPAHAARGHGGAVASQPPRSGSRGSV